jgi:hypothetical protein
MTCRNVIQLVAVCLLAQLSPVRPPYDQKREARMVLYSDIPEKVQIIGKLGRPLGELVSVRGTWREYTWAKPGATPPKPGLPELFVVDQVNGRRLDRPAEFDNVEQNCNLFPYEGILLRN